MQSKAKTVEAYIQSLPIEQAEVVRQVRAVILKNLPKGYEEGIQYGMIGYFVPLSLHPAGYLNKKDVPLPFMALASQKNYFSLYTMTVYGNKDLALWFKAEYQKGGYKLDMGKSCIRFKKLEQLNLAVVGELVAKVPVKKFIEAYEQLRGGKR